MPREQRGEALPEALSPTGVDFGRARLSAREEESDAESRAKQPPRREGIKKLKGRPEVAINNKARLERERREQVDEAGVTLDRRRKEMEGIARGTSVVKPPAAAEGQCTIEAFRGARWMRRRFNVMLEK